MRFGGRSLFPYVVLILGGGATLWALSFSKLPPADFTFCNQDEIKTVDPARVTGVPEGRVVRELFEGLCNWHPRTLEPVPGVAESWTISEDKLTYTFKIRENALWSDGTRVTADDFAWSFRRFLHPDTPNEYAYQLWYVEGAQRYTELKKEVGDLVEVELERADDAPEHAPGLILHGKLVAVEAPPQGSKEPVYIVDVDGQRRRFQKDGIKADEPYKWLLVDFETVAIKALDERTLRIKLKHPTPYFLNLMGFYPLFPVNRRCVERYGFPLWTKPGNIVCNGPFVLQDRRIRDRVRLVKNPMYWNRDNVQFNVVDVLAVKSGPTMLNLYLTGKVDWIPGVPSTVVPELLAQYPNEFKPAPHFGTYYYRLNVTRPPLDNRLVRRALALAVEKREITDRIVRAGQVPARSFVPIYIEKWMNYHPAFCEEYDPDEARRLLAKAGFPGGRGFPRIDILYNFSEDHRAIAELVQSQWQTVLGIEVGLRQLEWVAYLQNQAQLQYSVSRAAWSGDYVDPNTFLDMFVTGGGNNQTGWSNAKYDRLIDSAQREGDVEKRADLLHQAERILMDEMPIIPIYHYVSLDMVRPYVKGFHYNLQSIHPLQDMRIDPEEKARVLTAAGLD